MRAAGAPSPVRHAALAAGLLLLASGPATAQLPVAPKPVEAPAAEPAPAAPAAPAPPQAIPLADVAAAAERATAMLAAVTRTLEVDPTVAGIEAALAARREELERDRDQLRAEIDAGRSLRSLGELDLMWRNRGDALRAWVEILGKRVVQIQDARDEAGRVVETWQATLAEADADEAPADVVQRIAAVIGMAEEVRVRARERAAGVLTLQGAAADLVRQTDAVVQELGEVRGAVESQLFRPEHPPLWEAVGERKGLRAALDRARESVARDVSLVRALDGEVGRHATTYGALLLLFLPITYALRARSRVRRREGRSLGAADWVFDYPISLAVLATLPLCWWWIFPELPPPLLRLFSLLVWIPTVRVLRRLVPAGLHPALYALAGFYVFDRLRDVLGPALVAERLLYALELAAAVALLVWLLRPQRLAGVSAEAAPPRGLGIVLRIAVVALAASLVANVLGYVDLARLVGETWLGAAYLAVILFAVARVLQLVMMGVLRTPPLRRLRVVQRHGDRILHHFSRVVAWTGGGLWLWIATRFLGVRDALVAGARRVLGAQAEIGNLAFSLGDVVVFAVTLWLSLWVSRMLRVVLEDEVFPRASLARGVPHAISAVAQYAVMLIGFLLAAGAAGFDWSRLTLLAGAFGVGIGFGLQNVINNFVSGLILLFERPVQVGDTVQQGELIGEVRRIGIRSSTVRTAEGAEVIVPNGDLISQRVVNWTLSDRNRRIDLPVGVAYGTDPARVLALLDRVARDHPDTLTDPEPMALFRAFGASSLDFELRIWTARPERMLTARSELAVAVYGALAAEGIEVPFPQQDLRIVGMADDVAQALARAGDGQPVASVASRSSAEKR